MTYIFSSCVARELSDQEFKVLIKRVESAHELVTIDEDKEFLQSILDDYDLLHNDDVLNKVEFLIDRIMVVVFFERSIAKGVVSGQEELDKIEGWLKNQKLLDDPTIRKEAHEEIQQLLERIQKGDMLYLQLKWIEPEIEDPAKKEQIKYWLDNKMLVYDEDVQKEIEIFITQLSSEIFAPGEGVGKKFKTIRNICVLLYTAYRKFRFISNLATQSDVGWSGYFDHLVALSYIGSKEYEKSLKEGMARFMNSSLDSAPAKAFSGRDKWRFIVREDVQDFIEKKGAKFLNRDIYELKKDSYFKESYDSLGWFQQNKALKELREHGIKKAKKDIYLNGCQGDTLDFYCAFDKELDEMLERGVDSFFDPEDISLFRKLFWKNDFVRIIRRSVLLKILPLYLYWLWYGREDPSFGPVYNPKDDWFYNWMPFKEGIKSAEYFLRLKGSAVIARKLNGKKDKDGYGKMDRLREQTFGLLGPNLIRMGLNLTSPRLTIYLSNTIKDKCIGEESSGEDRFLTERDYFKPNEMEWKRHVPKELMAYSVRNVAFYSLSKVFGKFRPKIVDWGMGKAKKFVDFLARRGWISSDWWEKMQKMNEDFQDDFPVPLGVAVGSIAMLIVMLVRGFPRNMTTFDIEVAFLASSKSGDVYCLLDHLAAFWIGDRLGDYVSDKGLEWLEA